jgi:hypothetical protein
MENRMTYLFVNNQEIKNDVGNPIPVVFGSASATSAFGEPIAVPITPVIQLDALYGLLPREFESFSASSGVVESTGTLMYVHTGTSPGGYGVIRSRRILRYRPGQGAMARFTAGFSTPHTNTTQRAGMFAQEQSLMIGYDGTQFGVLRQNGGKATIFELEVITAATGTQTATITLNGVAYTVQLTSGTALQNATEITYRSGGYPGWIVEQKGTKVHFLSQSVGVMAGAFTFSTTGNAVVDASVDQVGIANTLDWTYQADWNIDKLDGTGPSGVTLDPSKLNIFQISFRWLGAGEIRFAVENPENGDMIFFHHIHYSNRYTDVHIDNPSFKIGYVAANLTASTADDVHVFGASMLGAIEGIVTSNNYTRSVSSSKTSLTNNTNQHMMTIRNQTVTNGKINLRQFLAKKLSVAVQANDPVEVMLILNAPVGFQHVFSPVAEWSCTTVCREAGVISSTEDSVASYIIPINGSGTFDLTDLGIVIPAGNTLSVVIRSGQTIQSATTSMTWEEI